MIQLRSLAETISNIALPVIMFNSTACSLTCHDVQRKITLLLVAIRSTILHLQYSKISIWSYWSQQYVSCHCFIAKWNSNLALFLFIPAISEFWQQQQFSGQVNSKTVTGKRKIQHLRTEIKTKQIVTDGSELMLVAFRKTGVCRSLPVLTTYPANFCKSCLDRVVLYMCILSNLSYLCINSVNVQCGCCWNIFISVGHSWCFSWNFCF